MTAKVIYFTVGEKDEQAEFTTETPVEDVKDLFRSAAEAGLSDILKLYNIRKNLINISPKLEENTPDTRYKLEVVAANCLNCSSCGNRFGTGMDEIEKRLQELEKKILIENGDTPPVVMDIKSKVDSFRQKLESVEHLSWLGLFKEMLRNVEADDFALPSSIPVENDKNTALLKPPEHYQVVFDKYLTLSDSVLTEETKQLLRKPTFDNWQWEEAEMLYLLQEMYIDLNLVEIFNIEKPILQHFLFDVYRHYNQIPFHNFRHCFCVTQMMYGLIWLTGLKEKIEDYEVLTMLTSALCHDLDHPGYNNAYQVNARTELAIRYNDISPLENHHASVAFDIISNPESNILSNVSQDVFKKVREGMIMNILATDMARHSEILNSFKEIMKQGFQFKNKQHVSVLMKIMIKVSDVSNEARPMDVAEPWLDCLLSEFFNQSDLEKLEGLPVAPFMDREKVTKPSAQIGFIKFVLIPLFEALGELFPLLEEHLIRPVKEALHYYTNMGKTMEEELKKNQESKEKKDDSETRTENSVDK